MPFHQAVDELPRLAAIRFRITRENDVAEGRVTRLQASENEGLQFFAGKDADDVRRTRALLLARHRHSAFLPRRGIVPLFYSRRPFPAKARALDMPRRATYNRGTMELDFAT
ncbi:MAG: hypothetical protein Q8M76_02435, partial [Spirochaetaceae bacterium]|nr:hypothetical protein [Spirochaetaceae bacterium]